MKQDRDRLGEIFRTLFSSLLTPFLSRIMAALVSDTASGKAGVIGVFLFVIDSST